MLKIIKKVIVLIVISQCQLSLFQKRSIIQITPVDLPLARKYVKVSKNVCIKIFKLKEDYNSNIVYKYN